MKKVWIISRLSDAPYFVYEFTLSCKILVLLQSFILKRPLGRSTSNKYSPSFDHFLKDVRFLIILLKVEEFI
nr:MAG TPA: hypothetical protein [Crassvirales sp.]